MDLICAECGRTEDNPESVVGWVQLPARFYGVIEWWAHCPDCASPEAQRESLDALLR